MKRLAVLAVVLGACDPIWGVNTTLRDPMNHPIESATVAVACGDGIQGSMGMAVRSDRDGVAHVGGMGTRFPVGCDLFVAKPGYRTQRIRYHDICPLEPGDCDRVFAFDLVLEPERI